MKKHLKSCLLLLLMLLTSTAISAADYFELTANADNSTVFPNRAILLINDDYPSNPTVYPNSNLQYSLDNGSTWQYFSNKKVTLSKGQKMLLKGTSLKCESYPYTIFEIEGDVKASGNIYALFGGTSMKDNETFEYLFLNCKGLTETSADLLSAKNLTPACYRSMFLNSGLKKGPNLPAEQLKSSCYENMFSGCTSLTTMPVIEATVTASSCCKNMFSGTGVNFISNRYLNATTLAEKCYEGMFSDCKSLTNMPTMTISSVGVSSCKNMFNGCTALNSLNYSEFNATMLSESCYEGMFEGCTSLAIMPKMTINSIGVGSCKNMFKGCKKLNSYNNTKFASTLTTSCYEGMFEGCTSLTALPVMTIDSVGVSSCKNMFNGCTAISLNNSEFNATKLSESCYEGMFAGCTSLTTMPKLNFTSVGVASCKNMFKGCKKLNSYNSSTFASTLTTSCYEGMFEGCTSLTALPVMTIDSVGVSSCKNMFNGCTAISLNNSTFKATTLSANCYEGMFDGCTSLTTMPNMSITSVGVASCKNMFKGCTKLNSYNSSTFASTLTTSCYEGMFEGCTSLTTTPKMTISSVGEASCRNMFKGTGINSLNNISFKATTLSANCYEGMFDGCKSLTSLPSTFLKDCIFASYCCKSMFAGCSNLSSAKFSLSGTSEGSFSHMFENCIKLTEIPELNNNSTYLANNCYESMFEGCSSLEEAIIPTTSLGEHSFKRMFANCTSLSKIQVNFSSWTVKKYSYSTTLIADDWVKNVAKTGSFYYTGVGLYGLEVRYGDDYIPENWKFKGVYSISYDENVVSFYDFPEVIYSGDVINFSVEPKEGYYPVVTVKGCDYRYDDVSAQFYFDMPTANVEISVKYYKDDCLTFKALYDNVKIGIENHGSNNPDLEYSVDYGYSWKKYNQAITLAKNKEVRFRGENPTGFSTSLSNYTSFTVSSASVQVSGNVMSLIDKKGEIREIPCNYCFYRLFANSRINNVNVGLLPATKLKEGCYREMFESCPSVNIKVNLPATSLSANCYNAMYKNTGITQAPALPATTLASYCYSNMFSGCSKLTTAPALPATTLASYCYSNMFSGCSELTTAPALPATTLASYCYSNMFSGCSKLTTAPALPATTLASYCYSNMFSGCESLTTAPALPATTLSSNCYADMFSGCESLTTAPALPATTLSSNCYADMFSGCESLTTAPNLPAMNLASFCYVGMFNNCTSLTKAPNLPATTLQLGCYERMFFGCSALTTVQDLPAKNLATQCYQGMFSGCTNLTNAPEIKATVLATRSCYGMFLGCTKLNAVYVNFTDWHSDATTNWLDNVATSGNFYCPSALAKERGTSNIPNGWNVYNACKVTINEGDICWFEDVRETYNTNTTVRLKVKQEAFAYKTFTISGAINKYTYSYTDGYLVFTMPNEDVTISFVRSSYYDGLIVVANEASTVKYSSPNNCEKYGIEYTTSEGNTWKPYNAQVISLKKDEFVRFRGNGKDWTDQFTMTGNVYVGGKVCYLTDKTGASNNSLRIENRQYFKLFADCSAIHSVSESLLDPAQYAGVQSYNLMFLNCTNLEVSPRLSAQFFDTNSYQEMFYGCSKLRVILCYGFISWQPKNEKGEQITFTDGWVNGVSKTGTFVCHSYLPKEYGPNRIPDGWTVHEGGISFYKVKLSENTKSNGYVLSSLDPNNSYVESQTIEFRVLDRTIEALKPVVSVRANGKNIEVVESNGTYSFAMPNNTVTIDVQYVSNKPTFIVEKTANANIAVSTMFTQQVYEGSNVGFSLANGVDDDVVVSVKNKKTGELVSLSKTGKTYSFVMPESDVQIDVTYQLANYLTFKSESGTSKVTLKNNGTNNPNVTYSTDGLLWLNMTSGTAVSIEQGKVLYVRGNNPNGFSMTTSKYTSFSISGNVLASGSVMSLIDNKGEITEIPNSNCFLYLFAGSTGLKKVDDDLLPALKLKDMCYGTMFVGCTALTNAPKLPAPTLSMGCYVRMFMNCSSLVTAPELPASTLADGCYSNMFDGCTKLTNAPELPATELKAGCYDNMFANCTTLVKTPYLPAEKLVDGCYTEMFKNCPKLSDVSVNFSSWEATGAIPTWHWLENVAASGSFNSPNELSIKRGTDYIPTNWTIVGAPKVTFAPSVAENNYVENTATEVYRAGTTVTFTLTDEAVDAHVYATVNGNELLDVAVNGKQCSFVVPESDVTINVTKCLAFVAESESYVSYGVSYGMDPYIECSLDNGLTWDYYVGGEKDIEAGHLMLVRGNNPEGLSASSDDYVNFHIEGKVGVRGNVMSLIDQKGDTKTIPNVYCFYSLFAECSGLTAVDDNLLPATTLAANCYGSMFEGCSSLQKAPELPAEQLVNGCYAYMFSDCKKLQLVNVEFTSWGNNCTTDWLKNVAPTGVFNCPDALPIEQSVSKVPSGWAVNGVINTVKFAPSIAENGYVTNGTDDKTYLSGETVKFTLTTKASEVGVYVITDDNKLVNVTRSGNKCTFVMPKSDVTINVTNCLAFVAMQNGSSVGMAFEGTNNANVEYSTDLATWQPLTSAVSADKGNVIFVRGNNPSGFSKSTSNYAHFAITGEVEAQGSVMSLIDEKGDIAEIPNDNCFNGLFENCTGLKKVPMLNATTLKQNCYLGMFAGCTSLSEAPTLPAGTMMTNCYKNMFSGCISLTKAPQLPAENLAEGCYQYMFNNCYSLKDAPELPATELYKNCYCRMFNGCSSLQVAPNLMAKEVPNTSYSYMFSGCTRLNTLTVGFETWNTNGTQCWLEKVSNIGTFYCPSELNIPKRSVTYIPEGWNVERTSCKVNLTNEALSQKYITTEFNSSYKPGEEVVFELAENAVDAYLKIRLANNDSVSFDRTNNRISFVMPQEDVTIDVTNCLIFVSHQNGSTIGFKKGSTNPIVEYSLDNGNTWSFLTDAITLDLAESVRMRGCNIKGYKDSKYQMTGRLAAYGSVMSLIDSFGVAKEIPCMSCFNGLFEGCSSLIKAPRLTATKLTAACYQNMFANCTGLTVAPELPATSLTLLCYKMMFSGCTKLTTAPALPATTLASSCYNSMFYGCTGLTNAPAILPATTLATSCYNSMFYNCTSLTNAPTLPATTLATSCYASMFNNCRALVDAPELPATKLAESCYSDMFTNCKSLLQAPALPATTLAKSCYKNMFTNCDTLLVAPSKLPATTLYDACYYSMFSGCHNLLNAPELPATALAANCYNSMFSGCGSLTQAPALPAETLALGCYSKMFSHCTELVSAPALPAVNLAESCYSQMFKECSSLVVAPELPATELFDGCYFEMFTGCSKLNSIKVAFSSWDEAYTADWMADVDSTGQFICPKELEIVYNDTCIHTNWNVRKPYDVKVTARTRTNGYVVSGNEQPYFSGESVTIDVKDVPYGWNAVVMVYDEADDSTEAVVVDDDTYTFTMPESDAIVDVKYYWSEDVDHIAPFEFSDTTITYSRKTKNWGTICLPYSFKASDGNVQLYRVESVDDDVLNIVQVTSVEAGEPVLFYNSNPNNLLYISCNIDDVTTYAGSNGAIVGTFSKLVVGKDNGTVAENCYYLKDNKFYHGNGNFTVLPFYAYITTPNNSNNSLRIDIKDVVEENVAESDKQVRGVFNMSGQRVGRMNDKGVYVIIFDDGTSQKVRISE